MDVESVNSDSRRSLGRVNSPDGRRSIEINAELVEREGDEPGNGDAQGKGARPSPPPAAADLPASGQDKPPQTASPDDAANGPAQQESPVASVAGGGGLSDPPAKAKSTVSAASTPASLTKERLPRTLSRVAMSYRTNEWAKHLGYADTPEPDPLHVEPARPGRASRERAAPSTWRSCRRRPRTGQPRRP